MRTVDIQYYKECKYFCYGKYCSKPYLTEKKLFGYSDLSEYYCPKHKYGCNLFEKKTLWQKIKEKIFKKII